MCHVVNTRRAMHVKLDPFANVRGNLHRRVTSGRKPSGQPNLHCCLSALREQEWFPAALAAHAVHHVAFCKEHSLTHCRWNIPYGFDDGDLRISARQLHMYISDNATVPFTALKYAIGECNYGGRVTDDKDRLLLNTILDRVYRPEILVPEGFALSSSGIYAVPVATGGRDFFLQHIAKLPLLPQVCHVPPAA
jgi:hypothetical protein